MLDVIRVGLEPEFFNGDWTLPVGIQACGSREKAEEYRSTVMKLRTHGNGHVLHTWGKLFL
jgi:hypothetical protein